MKAIEEKSRIRTQTRIRFRSPVYLLTGIQIFFIYKKSYSALFPTSRGLQAPGIKLSKNIVIVYL